MIDDVMKYFNIIDYRYDVKDNTLFIYKPIIVKEFIQIKKILWNILIVIKKYGKRLPI